jgi:DNA-binding NarL/FixJ family response regulator
MEGLHASFPVREVTRRETLESTIAALAPDVLLLDLDLLKLGGIGDGPVIRSLARQTLVVLMSEAPNEREGIRVLKAGARGYCQKTFEMRVLCKAVDRVRDGEIWAERKLIARLLEEYSSDPSHNPDLSVKSDGRLDLLTPREREIASLIAGGASNKEIASRLGVGEGTVKAHLTGVFRKLGFSDRLQLGLFLVNPSVQRPSLGR